MEIYELLKIIIFDDQICFKMFKNDKYRSKLTRYSTNMDTTFREKKGISAEKQFFLSFWTKKYNI